MKKNIKDGLEETFDKSVDKVGGFMKEFKNFALKKNILDLAVAVVVGGAFGKIVTSLVNDIIMPFLSMIIGTSSFDDLKIIITTATETTEEVAIQYGSFIQTLIDFIIIAFFIFIALKIITKSQKALEETIDKLDGIEGNLKPNKKTIKPTLTTDQKLLTEIVDLLKKQENGILVTEEKKIDVIKEKPKKVNKNLVKTIKKIN